MILGNIHFLHGNPADYYENQYQVVPKVGDMYLFPNYLLHTVYPFTDTEEERRSVSFNAIIDEPTASI